MLALSALFTTAALGDEHEKKPMKAAGKEMSMTGCLNKGEMENHYAFSDQKTGKKMTVTGSPDLSKHAMNHTVKLTGSRAAKVFNVTMVEHVSPTCEAAHGDAKH
ncbi:MAG: hypothetical protein H7039_11510 [Bryobacteraceae bacterium]|nr:hypothetical protein [Bryobacteraceae bacterium]